MRARQNELLYQHASTALLASAVAGAAVVFVYLHLTPLTILLGWASVLFVVLGLRALLIARFFNSPERQHAPRRWYLGFVVTTLLSGSIWGSSGFILVPTTAAEPQFMLYTAMALLICCALAAASLATYSIRLDSYLAFALPCVLPMGIGFLFSEHDFIRTLGLLATLYMMFLILFALRISRTTTASLVREKKHSQLLKALQQERDKANTLAARMQRLSTQDSVTGIANRRHLDEILEREWGRAIRFSEPFSLILGDLDFFKPYNDLYGHQAGDDCLRSVAQLLHQFSRRASDLAARYGGEEFAVVLPTTDARAAEKLAEAMRANIEALNIPHGASRDTPYITMSFGVATIIPRQHDDIQSFIKSVDLQLYRAKRLGRNRVCSAKDRPRTNNEDETIQVKRWHEDQDSPLDTASIFQEFANRGYRCSIQNFRPDTAVGQHAHFKDEINLVLSGEITIRFQEQHFQLKPGDYIHVPSHHVHEATIGDDQPLRMLIAVRESPGNTTSQAS